MSIADNLRQLRTQKDLLQKEVAAALGLKPAHYNKIESGTVEPSIQTLDKLAAFYGITIDQVVHFQGELPKNITLEDKAGFEQVKLISQLDEEDKTTVFKIIETFLTKKKFKDFFQNNVASL